MKTYLGMNSFYYWNVHELSFVENVFPYALFEIRTKAKHKHKHMRSVVPHITGCSCWMSLSHSDCPLVVSCVSHTLQLTWLWQWITMNSYFVLDNSCVMYCALKPYSGTIWEKHQQAAKRRRLSHIVHWSAQLAKSWLQSLPSLWNVLHHISKDKSIIQVLWSEPCRDLQSTVEKAKWISKKMDGKLYLEPSGNFLSWWKN